MWHDNVNDDGVVQKRGHNFSFLDTVRTNTLDDDDNDDDETTRSAEELNSRLSIDLRTRSRLVSN